jgi:heme exporter protein CcmD
MGDYGWFVWPSYILVLGALVALIVLTARAHKRWSARVAELEAERDARKAAAE